MIRCNHNTHQFGSHLLRHTFTVSQATTNRSNFGIFKTKLRHFKTLDSTITAKSASVSTVTHVPAGSIPQAAISRAISAYRECWFKKWSPARRLAITQGLCTIPYRLCLINSSKIQSSYQLTALDPESGFSVL